MAYAPLVAWNIPLVPCHIVFIHGHLLRYMTTVHNFSYCDRSAASSPLQGVFVFREVLVYHIINTAVVPDQD